MTCGQAPLRMRSHSNLRCPRVTRACGGRAAAPRIQCLRARRAHPPRKRVGQRGRGMRNRRASPRRGRLAGAQMVLQQCPHVHPRPKSRREQIEPGELAMQKDGIRRRGMPGVLFRAQRQSRVTQARGQVRTAEIVVADVAQRLAGEREDVEQRRGAGARECRPGSSRCRSRLHSSPSDRRRLRRP